MVHDPHSAAHFLIQFGCVWIKTVWFKPAPRCTFFLAISWNSNSSFGPLTYTNWIGFTVNLEPAASTGALNREDNGERISLYLLKLWFCNPEFGMQTLDDSKILFQSKPLPLCLRCLKRAVDHAARSHQVDCPFCSPALLARGCLCKMNSSKKKKIQRNSNQQALWWNHFCFVL